MSNWMWDGKQIPHGHLDAMAPPEFRATRGHAYARDLVVAGGGRQRGSSEHAAPLRCNDDCA
eukprot:2254436-Lingulodinium_polyedra.AAC.1